MIASPSLRSCPPPASCRNFGRLPMCMTGFQQRTNAASDIGGGTLVSIQHAASVCPSAGRSAQQDGSQSIQDADMAMTAEDVKKMKVQELRDELTKRGLDSTGLKAALAERLEESIQGEENGQAEGGAQAPLADAAQPSEAAAPPAAAANGELKEGAAPAAAAETDAGKIVYKDPAEEELAKKKARAARFGMPLNLSEDKKAAMRAQRFGLETKAGDKRKAEAKAVEPAKKQPSTAELEAELQKKKARAARFNVPVKTNADEEKLRLKARQERFKDQLTKMPASTTGNSKPTAAGASDIEAKKKARAERFGIKA